MVPSTWGGLTAFCQVTGKDTGLILSSQGAYSAAQEQGSWDGGGVTPGLHSGGEEPAWIPATAPTPTCLGCPR